MQHFNIIAPNKHQNISDSFLLVYQLHIVIYAEIFRTVSVKKNSLRIMLDILDEITTDL